MIAWKNMDTLATYQKLLLAQRVELSAVMSADGAQRVRRCNIPAGGGLTFNYGASPVDDTLLELLGELAREAQLAEKYEALYQGAVLNTSEQRRVLHHLTRGQLGQHVVIDGVDQRAFYIEQQRRAAEFAEKVHRGEIVNAAGERFTTVVQIGIGGSDLGPRALYLALEHWAQANDTLKMRAAFISNADPDDAAGTLGQIDLARSLFIVVSKSGTTLETLANGEIVRNALGKAGLDPARHMLAVTGAGSPMDTDTDYLETFLIDDCIGGRYASTSAVGGVLLSLAFGPETFARLLDGAAEADALARERDVRNNAAMLDALIGIYQRNILGYPATAVLPYSQALHRFPAHLQQLDMESNGKSVNRFGETLEYATGPLVFGETGTNGQHSFFQMLHQGSDVIPLQFIGFRSSQLCQDAAVQGSTGQQKLCANMAAQIVAFACGHQDTVGNKRCVGGRPSTLLVGDRLTPEALGGLLAHFENKVMFQGFIWNINSFDQEGVQLGKALARRVLTNDTDGALRAYSELLGIG